jgi:hypothetical protein
MPTSSFLLPRYDSGGFAGLPARLAGLLADRRYDAVVLFLVDGFGWCFFDRFQQTGFLEKAARRGQVEKLTAQFPSTTSAHITTLHTGLPVGEHGVFEWNIYEPDLEAIITPLLFSFAGTPERDTLKQAGAKPRRLFPFTSLYPGLKKQGVSSHILQHREYTPSTYSDLLFRGAAMRGYRTLPEALVNLGLLIEKTPAPTYCFLYYDRIDAVSHEYGPGAPQTEAEIQATLTTMEQILQPGKFGGKKVLCLLTADHGQVAVDPTATVYLNREARFAGLRECLRTDRLGNPLVPAGSARDFFLYTRAGMLDQARALLASGLEGQAEVRTVAELVSAGAFGLKISETFLARAGDLVILPFAGESVWWYEKDRFEQRFRGHHGGLTPEEIEIPLLTWEA